MEHALFLPGSMPLPKPFLTKEQMNKTGQFSVSDHRTKRDIPLFSATYQRAAQSPSRGLAQLHMKPFSQPLFGQQKESVATLSLAKKPRAVKIDPVKFEQCMTNHLWWSEIKKPAFDKSFMTPQMYCTKYAS